MVGGRGLEPADTRCRVVVSTAIAAVLTAGAAQGLGGCAGAYPSGDAERHPGGGPWCGSDLGPGTRREANRSCAEAFEPPPPSPPYCRWWQRPQLAVQPGPGNVATTYAFDANGNQTAAGSKTFTYDRADRLLTATVGTTTETYAYSRTTCCRSKLRVTRSLPSPRCAHPFSMTNDPLVLAHHPVPLSRVDGGRRISPTRPSPTAWVSHF
jgi:hypothetical protein